MCHTDKDGKVIHTNGKRSHYSVVEQPDAVPLGMFVPDKSTGKIIYIYSVHKYKINYSVIDDKLCNSKTKDKQDGIIDHL